MKGASKSFKFKNDKSAETCNFQFDLIIIKFHLSNYVNSSIVENARSLLINWSLSVKCFRNGTLPSFGLFFFNVMTMFAIYGSKNWNLSLMKISLSFRNA